MNVAGDYGYSPLLYAVREGKLDAVKFLIERKANVRQANKREDSPLHVACNMGDDAVGAQIAEILLDNGAKLEKRNFDSKTPLLIALQFCSPQCVKLLLERKADTSAKAPHGDWANTTAAGIAEAYDDEMLELFKQHAQREQEAAANKPPLQLTVPVERKQREQPSSASATVNQISRGFDMLLAIAHRR